MSQGQFSMALLEFMFLRVSLSYFFFFCYLLITFPRGVQRYLRVKTKSPYGFFIFELLRWGFSSVCLPFLT